MTISIEDIVAAATAVQNDLRADETLVPRLYAEDGWTIAQIARHTGFDRSTIYRKLEKAGVYTPTGKPGAPRKGECQRGHDMAVHGREISPGHGGGRYCSECKRARERVSWKPVQQET